MQLNDKKFNELKWRCRRGMREMDILLDQFLETHYANLSSEQQLYLTKLLDMQDPQLFALMMRANPAENEIEKSLIDLINPIV